MFELKNKVAIVTGGARGIGKAIALKFAEQGAHVVVADIISGESVAKQIRRKKRKSIFIKTDVTKDENLMNLIDTTIKKFKKIDILVNNAGVFYPTPVEKTKIEDFKKTIDINMYGYLKLAKLCFPHLKKTKGNIINIASIAGISAFANSAAYNMSKGAVNMLTKSLANDWGKYNIRCNSICPGVIVTAMTKPLLKDKGFNQMIKQGVPLARPGNANEIAHLAVYLASDESSYTTGTLMVVDGGWTCHL